MADADEIERRARHYWRQADGFGKRAQSQLDVSGALFWVTIGDAVTAIKKSLHSFLLFKIATAGKAQPNGWREAERGDKMPDLLAACGSAGLNLSDIESELKELNDLRNHRLHDKPRYQVSFRQAKRATELVETVQQRVESAVQASAFPEFFVRSPAAPSTSVPEVAAPVRPPAEPAPIPEIVAATPAEEAEQPAAEVRAARMARRPIGLYALLAAALVVLLALTAAGVLAAEGLAPSWLYQATAHLQAPATPTATTAPTTPTAPPAAASGPMTIGALAVAAPLCALGRATLALTTTGAQTLAYSAASAGTSAGTTVATTAVGMGQPAVFGALKPGASQTLYFSTGSAAESVIITTPAGAVQLLLPTC